MNYIQGIVKAILYHNEENAYTIIKIEITDITEDTGIFLFEEGDYITVTGYMSTPMRGEEIRFFGEIINHPKYGMQYQTTSYEKQSETSYAGLIEYLSSDLFPGVGIKTAERIVKTLGTTLVSDVIKDGGVLDKVPKLTKKQKQVIIKGLIDNKAAEHALIRLYSYGVSPKMAMRIFKHYQTDTISIIEENPYQLIQDIEGIGFERADQIARLLGWKEDHPYRVKAMILYLYQLMGVNHGHTFLYYEQLIDYLFRALNRKREIVAKEDIEKHISNLVEEDVLIQHDDWVKLKAVYYSEQNILEKIVQVSKESETEIDEAKLNKAISDFEKIEGIQYTKRQKQAIVQAISNNMFILTGGPGTGKTTVIKGLIYVYNVLFKIPPMTEATLHPVKLVAPTGRAAKRMQEATGFYAQTIHRFLGYNFDGTFMHNKNNQISADMIIVDEASMIDVFLASQLLQSIPKNSKLVIVGDENQLPSVGPGQILKDFLDSGMIESVKLDRIHRQGQDSKIVDLAYHINQGQLPKDIKNVYDDLMFVEEVPEHFQKRLLSSLYYLLEQGYDLWKDVQVLIPMYRGITGIDNVNKLIQKHFNQNEEKVVSYGNVEFRINDKVIQLVNQIEDGVMNGDQGIVVGIPEEGVVVVDFDGTQVTYKKGDLVNLKHAYAMSIHKSQGSEYKVVILPVFRNYSVMLKRKLLYTAVTRAKKKLIILGELDSFFNGVSQLEAERQSTLKDDLIAAIMSGVSDQKMAINDEAIPFEYLGEDLNNLSPYDFMDEE
jgi:exodeoxyribonuclease V alpha subunit